MGEGRYSQEQVERARQTDMVDFLEKRLGVTFEQGNIVKVKQHGNGGQYSSLVVHKGSNRAFYNAEGNKSYNAVDWLMIREGYSYQAALEEILHESPDGTKIQSPTYKPAYKVYERTAEAPVKQEFEMPVLSSDTRRSFAYLTQARGIPDYIVNSAYQEGIIKEDERHNVVFVGYDNNNEAKYGAKRGTYTPAGKQAYKRDVSGSDKAFAFKLVGKDTETIYVTEAAIDALSLAAIEDRFNGKDAYKEKTFISTGGAGVDNAIEQFCKDHNVKVINICFDNDQAGENGMRKIMEKYQQQGYVVNDMRASMAHDYNDELIQLNANPNFYPAPPITTQKGSNAMQSQNNDLAKYQQEVIDYEINNLVNIGNSLLEAGYTKEDTYKILSSILEAGKNAVDNQFGTPQHEVQHNFSVLPPPASQQQQPQQSTWGRQPQQQARTEVPRDNVYIDKATRELVERNPQLDSYAKSAVQEAKRIYADLEAKGLVTTSYTKNGEPYKDKMVISLSPAVTKDEYGNKVNVLKEDGTPVFRINAAITNSVDNQRVKLSLTADEPAGSNPISFRSMVAYVNDFNNGEKNTSIVLQKDIANSNLSQGIKAMAGAIAESTPSIRQSQQQYQRQPQQGASQQAQYAQRQSQQPQQATWGKQQQPQYQSQQPAPQQTWGRQPQQPQQQPMQQEQRTNWRGQPVQQPQPQAQAGYRVTPVQQPAQQYRQPEPQYQPQQPVPQQQAQYQQRQQTPYQSPQGKSDLFADSRLNDTFFRNLKYAKQGSFHENAQGNIVADLSVRKQVEYNKVVVGHIASQKSVELSYNGDTPTATFVDFSCNAGGYARQQGEPPYREPIINLDVLNKLDNDEVRYRAGRHLGVDIPNPRENYQTQEQNYAKPKKPSTGFEQA